MWFILNSEDEAAAHIWTGHHGTYEEELTVDLITKCRPNQLETFSEAC